jgi:hypothetical protein
MLNQEQIGDLVDRKKYLESQLSFANHGYKDPQLHTDLKNVKKQLSENKKESTRKALAKAHKICTACGQEKPLNAFYVDNRSYTGYSSKCKSCEPKKK